jgi:hypothetical protein
MFAAFDCPAAVQRVPVASARAVGPAVASRGGNGPILLDGSCRLGFEPAARRGVYCNAFKPLTAGCPNQNNLGGGRGG